MSTTLTVNGVGFAYPQTGDESWGDNASAWAAAVTSGMLQKAGGSFTLTAEVDFGATFGLKSTSYKSRAANPSGTGVLRLGNTEAVSWRNAANNADLALIVNASNLLVFDGAILVDTASIQTLANKSMSGADNTFTNIPYSALTSLAIVNADVSASAAIAYSKLNLASSIVNADVSASAAIAYSKLNLATSIVNADISLSAAIAYSKLNLAGSIVNADVAALAAIAHSKMAALTANRVMLTDGSGVASASSVTNTTLGYLDATSSVQTQLDAKVAKSTYSAKGSILAATAASTPANLNVGSDGQVLTADAAQSTGVKWATPASAPSSVYDATNLSIACSVASNALTIALKDSSGADASAGSPIKIGFRSSTATNGTYNQRSVTAALSTVISSGSTAGHSSGASNPIYVYALDNAGTVELAWSTSPVDEGSLQTTTAEGGAGAADSSLVLYSTTARSNVPVRLIGRLKSTQTTAGTWTAVPTEISTGEFATAVRRNYIKLDTQFGYGSTGTMIRTWTNLAQSGTAMTFTASTSNGNNGDKITINETGLYNITYTDVGNAATGFGITVNSTEYTTAFFSTTFSTRVCWTVSTVANNPSTCAWTGWLNAGDVLKAHGDGAALSAFPNRAALTIAKLSD